MRIARQNFSALEDPLLAAYRTAWYENLSYKLRQNGRGRAKHDVADEVKEMNDDQTRLRPWFVKAVGRPQPWGFRAAGEFCPARDYGE